MTEPNRKQGPTRGVEPRGTSAPRRANAPPVTDAQARKTALVVAAVLLAIAAWNFYRGRMTVVGVSASVRHFGLDDIARREIFRPYSQAAWPIMTIVVKTASDPASYAPAARAALQAIDPDLPVARVSTMEAIARNSTGSRRFPG